MSQTAAVWLVIALAALAANWPFISQRRLLLGPVHPHKRFDLRLLEMLLLYCAVGLIGRLLEGRMGAIHPQGWAFYVVTAALFATLGFPGFVWRYLLRHGQK